MERVRQIMQAASDIFGGNPQDRMSWGKNWDSKIASAHALYSHEKMDIADVASLLNATPNETHLFLLYAENQTRNVKWNKKFNSIINNLTPKN